jgi:7-carboxy-7-deazaguanine synthase
LAQRYTIELLALLLELGCMVQLETAGAYSLENIPVGIRRIVDVKTPGSGEVERNCMKNLDLLTAGDEVKFVLTSRHDYEWARDFTHRHLMDMNDVTILFSPAWGDIAASDLCAWVLQDHLPVRVQVQMHKIIWGPEAEGV